MITVSASYSDGNKVVTSINATLEEAKEYFKSFDRITECLETGKESAAKAISVSLVS